MNPLAFDVRLQNVSALLSVLTQISCLGGRLTRVVASETRARVDVLVPDRVVRHFANRLRRIVGVISLAELADDASPELMVDYAETSPGDLRAR